MLELLLVGFQRRALAHSQPLLGALLEVDPWMLLVLEERGLLQGTRTERLAVRRIGRTLEAELSS